MAQPLAMLMEPFYTTAPGPAVPPQPQQNPQRRDSVRQQAQVPLLNLMKEQEKGELPDKLQHGLISYLS